ncbi:JAB domain-containing protein [Sphingobium sp. YG1]|uniref:JAB domain-containing protein n=1 Tax=Sphingobium sp. YG1 TaxID=2082188 RepID=UPI000E76AE5C|nr:DNA repair protein RadC [Sphingobium sp. YG1]
MELVRPTGPDHRHLAAPDAIDTFGCRRALEELIGLTCPDRAQELSERLFARFGSLGETVSARSAARIELLDGSIEVEQTFLSFRRVMTQMLKGPLMQRPIFSSDQFVLDYLRADMAYDPIERFRVLFLNAGNELIADEVMGVGTVSAVQAWPREILKRCLDLEATAILLVHNHPSGCSKPSRADRDLTERIVKAASSLSVIVHDHLVVARKGTTSFRMAGYL